MNARKLLKVYENGDDKPKFEIADTIRKDFSTAVVAKNELLDLTI